MNTDISKGLHDRGICVIIPTYNNEKTISGVVNEALSFCDSVIVVNDGSTDSTTQALRSISGIILVSIGITLCAIIILIEFEFRTSQSTYPVLI